MSDGAAIRGHEEILQHTIELFRSFPIPRGVELQLPPPSTTALGMQFEEYVPARSLKATVVVSEAHANAVGVLQGGFIGPLSYLIARGPTASLELTTYFMRPVFPGVQLTLDAVVRKPGRTAMFIAAEAHDANNKLVATASSTVQVLPLSPP
jgi:acyl-coenzyme A thioesterase PaaI-like protein